MELLTRLATAALAGALCGALTGFITAVLALWAKQLRNAWLMHRGKSGYKDCVLPLPFVLFNAFLAAILSAALTPFLPTLRAVTIGTLTPAALLLLMSLAGALSQAVSD